MSNLVLTVIITFGLIVVAIACLAIGWLITGKSKVQAGACGRAPKNPRDKSCGTTETCQLCEKETVEKIDAAVDTATFEQPLEKDELIQEEQSEDDRTNVRPNR